MITTENREHYYCVPPDRLIEARGDRRPSEAARVLGVTRQRICDWEAGRYRISHSMLVRLSELYRRPLEFFLR
jgi:transcriptional regulator with XRE-family HTH domain